MVYPSVVGYNVKIRNLFPGRGDSAIDIFQMEDSN